MLIVLLCSDINHPVYPHLVKWKEANDELYDIFLVNSVEGMPDGGDILFLVSCTEIITEHVRSRFKKSLVLHASDLPEGRGWSPHIWDVINGKNELVLSLIDAADPVDTGDIWKKLVIPLDGSELYDEINKKVFSAELKLLSWACENVFRENPTPQSNMIGSYHPKRSPTDSELDVDKSIREQFNLLRVCDPERFPAHFTINGVTYKLKIEKTDP